MGKVNSYKELLIWQRAMDIAEDVYVLTRTYPKDEVFALTNQIRRSAVFVSSNIAEGYGRKSTASNVHFTKIARGSLYELETQLILSDRIGYITNKILFDSIIDSIAQEGKMINSYIIKLQDKIIDNN